MHIFIHLSSYLLKFCKESGVVHIMASYSWIIRHFFKPIIWGLQQRSLALVSQFVLANQSNTDKLLLW